MRRRIPSEWQRLAPACDTGADCPLFYAIALDHVAPSCCVFGIQYSNGQPNEVAVVLRFGGIADGGKALREPGLCWPGRNQIDQVIVVPVRKSL